jgi:hypothetical protein
LQGLKGVYFFFNTNIVKMTNKAKTVIVFMPDGTVRKYRNVGSIERFTDYCRKINAKYANFYDKITRNYLGRINFY